jgi:hypothetical protein
MGKVHSPEKLVLTYQITRCDKVDNPIINLHIAAGTSNLITYNIIGNKSEVCHFKLIES